MNVPIKFKGVVRGTGAVVYGKSLFDCPSARDALYIVDDGDYYLVYKTTLRRLVGYDESGNEIYEKCIPKGWTSRRLK